MARVLFAAFLVAHGLVHIAVWGSTTAAEAQGTGPAHSRLIGDQRSMALVFDRRGWWGWA